MQTFEDTLYNIANKALEKEFLALMVEKEDVVKRVVNEIFTEEMLKDWISDFIEYGDDFRNKVLEMAEDEMMNRVKGLFKDGSC